MTPFIGLHIGAGYHSLKKENDYQALSKKACQVAIEVLRRGGDSLEAVVEATKVLEDSELTNAGTGANLTLDGEVECDASVMEGRTLRFGAVGAIQRVKNPIRVAQELCQSQKQRLSLGRIHPCLLVGTGAVKFAEECNIPIINPADIITEKSKKIHKKYTEQLFASNGSEADGVVWKRVDTVGAVAVDQSGTISSCCSSGGVLLKRSGRIGQAGVFGCGCWAENSNSNNSVGVSVSGTGEEIIRTTLAKEVAKALKSSQFPVFSLNECVTQNFLESLYLDSESTKLCGLISLVTKNNSGDFMWCHTSASFGIAYMSAKDKNPTVRISRLPKHMRPGSKLIIEGISW